MSDRAWLVKLEFKRVQTFLFEGTRLKTMIGANTLLGEVLRGRKGTDDFATGESSLPELARKHGASKPEVGFPEQFGFELNTGDPLGKLDDPETAYQQGILARDGGHFHAVFPKEDQANDFIIAARQLIGRELPGLLLTSKNIPLEWTENHWKVLKEQNDEQANPGEDPFDLPQQQVCRVTGQGPAATIDDRQVPISSAVNAKHRAADRFDGDGTHDIVGLLKAPILSRLKPKIQQKKYPFPNEFEELARTSGYLAVIAADGNGIGRRSGDWCKRSSDADFFKREAWGEQFFYSMRTAVRQALVDALVWVFQPVAEHLPVNRQLPFRLLMQGGDDLLLVCDAVYASPFVVAYAQRLRDHPLVDESSNFDPKGEPGVHVGVGMAVVKKTFPFHRAHALAEQLAASAKRLYRSLGHSEKGSVVDWLAISEAWHEEVREVRSEDAVRCFRVGDKNETLILSRKPYRILELPNTGSRADSLEQLLSQARTMANWQRARGDETRVARSQLIGLGEAASQGRLQADWAVQLLPEEIRRRLESGILCDGGEKAVPRWSLWHPGRSETWSTTLLDFLELYELERLRIAHEPNIQKQ